MNFKCRYNVDILTYFNLDAMRLICNIKRTPANAASMKMAHFSNIGVTEVFLEATPTTFITTVLFLTVVVDYSGKYHGLKRVFFGGPGDVLSTPLFWVGYAASILSSSFGVSRWIVF